MTKPLWTPAPERIAQCNMRRFMTYVNQVHHLSLTNYDELYAWSITKIPAFWEAVWRFCRYPTLGSVHVYSGQSGHARCHPVSGGSAQLRREPAALAG